MKNHLYKHYKKKKKGKEETYIHVLHARVHVHVMYRC